MQRPQSAMLYDRLSDDCMLPSVTRYFQTPSKLPAPRTFTVYTCTECTRTGKHAPFRCTGYGRPSFSVEHPIESSAVRAKNVLFSFFSLPGSLPPKQPPWSGPPVTSPSDHSTGILRSWPCRFHVRPVKHLVTSRS